MKLLIALALTSSLTATAAQTTAQVKKTTKKQRATASQTAIAPASDSNHQLTSETIAKLSDISSTKKIKNNSISNYIVAPAEGTQSLTVSPAYVSKNQEYKASFLGTKSTITDKQNGTSLNFDFNKGLENNISLNVHVSADNMNGTSKVENAPGSNYTKSGLSDIWIGTKQTVEQTDSQKFYGAFVTLSPADNSDSNNYSGGHSFGANYVNQFNYADSVMGLKTQAQYLLERKWESGAQWTGGHHITATAFSETTKSANIYGAEAGLQHTLASEVKVDSSSSSVGSYNTLLIGVYGIFNISKDIQFKPAIKFEKLVSESGGDVSLTSADQTSIEVAAQIAL